LAERVADVLGELSLVGVGDPALERDAKERDRDLAGQARRGGVEPAGLERVRERPGQRYGRLDVLINNAGIGPISPLDDLRVDEWDAMVDVNLKGVLHGIAAALPVFRAQGSGHFVNTASTAAHTIRPAMAVYSATKMAVRAISEGLRQEAGPNLRVTVITPGMTDTGFADDISNPEVRAQIAASKTDFGMPPAAIAHAMAYAIGQPPEVDVGEVIVRPTAQS
jgi:NADP-dependent 3-hydroxy acid dehydrogenase YdfG